MPAAFRRYNPLNAVRNLRLARGPTLARRARQATVLTRWLPRPHFLPLAGLQSHATFPCTQLLELHHILACLHAEMPGKICSAGSEGSIDKGAASARS